MASDDTAHILSDFIDAWNAGRRPDVDDYLAQAPASNQHQLAEELGSFLSFAPTPAYSDEAIHDISEAPEAKAAFAIPRDQLLPELLRRRRERMELTTAQLAEQVTKDLGLEPALTSKTASYLERWERGELAARKISTRVYTALSNALRISVEELERAADLVTQPPAPVFRSAAPAPAAAPPPAKAPKKRQRSYELFAEALATPGEADRDAVDDLFLGGR